MEKSIERIINHIHTTLVKKQHDYGSAASKPCLFGTADPLECILVRMSDKVSRLATLSKSKQMVEETFDDTLLDLAGYCVLYLATKENLNVDERKGHSKIG